MQTSETMRLMGIVTALAVGCTAGLLAMCWSARKARRRPLRLTRKTALSASGKGKRHGSVCHEFLMDFRDMALVISNRLPHDLPVVKYFMFFMMYPLCSGVVLCGINKGALAS